VTQSRTERNQLLLGYVRGWLARSRLRLEYDSVTKKRNQVFPSLRATTANGQVGSDRPAVWLREN
jgi:hypothetical protein